MSGLSPSEASVDKAKDLDLGCNSVGRVVYLVCRKPWVQTKTQGKLGVVGTHL